jgi:hypothetical protein
MSQFRIKHIDQGQVDEWVARLNDSGIQLGDDIDARDPNELSEALIDTQEVLLKTSVLAANQILNPTSGIAERLTILESTAGQATIQDAYQNGSSISLLSGRPLVFGVREEFRLDDAGNLSFNPVTMRVKGSGAAYLEFANDKVSSTLGDLFLGVSSPGFNLTTRSAGEFYLQDVYLNNPITLSESGDSSLATVSQSIIGAINELKSSAFNVTFQSVYDQSNPTKIITNLSLGPLIVEDGNATSLGDAFRVIGNQTITKKLTINEVQIGSNLSVADGIGLSTVDPIQSAVEVKTPLVNAGINDLRLQDKRLSVLLTENGDSSLDTNSGSIIGALNELKGDITNVGGTLSLFDNEHDSSTGAHKIITTKADLGDNALKRIIVKDQTDTERFSITGEGSVFAESLSLSGLNVGALLVLLNNHLADDGTSHAAVQSHLLDSNPHDTVKSLLGLSGVLNLASPGGTVSISNSASTINIDTIDISTLQTSYDLLGTKEVSLLTASGLSFLDLDSSELIMMLRDPGVLFNRNINMEFAEAEINATTNLKIIPTTELELNSATEDVIITSENAVKTTIIQGIAFSEPAVTTIDPLMGVSILGTIRNLEDSIYEEKTYTMATEVLKGETVYFDSLGLSWLPITDIHPANIFQASCDFFHHNNSQMMVAAVQTVPGAATPFQHSGVILADIGAGNVPWEAGQDLYLAKKGYSTFKVEDISLVSDLDTISIFPLGLNKIITATTGVPDASLGSFKIESGSASSNINTDKTRDNIISLINNNSFNNIPSLELDARGAVDGEFARGALTVDTQLSSGDIVQLQCHVDSGGLTTSLTAVAVNAAPGWLEFAVGITKEETANNIAKAVNRTTIFGAENQSVVGHYCTAESSGVSATISWYQPGLTGRETAIVVSTPNITTAPFQGGTSELRMYRQDISIDVIPMTSSNPTGISATDISPCESVSQYIMKSEILSAARNTRNEQKIKVGSILSVSGNLAKIRVGK